LERGLSSFCLLRFSNELWPGNDAMVSVRSLKGERAVAVYESPWRGSTVSRWDLEIEQYGKGCGTCQANWHNGLQ